MTHRYAVNLRPVPVDCDCLSRCNMRVEYGLLSSAVYPMSISLSVTKLWPFGLFGRFLQWLRAVESIARPVMRSCFDLGNMGRIPLSISPWAGEKMWLRGCLIHTPYMLSDFLMIASVSCTSAFAKPCSRMEVQICLKPYGRRINYTLLKGVICQ